MAPHLNGDVLVTRVVPVQPTGLGKFHGSSDHEPLTSWIVEGDRASLESLQNAATYLQERDIPVGFPTETVYGLGADATRSKAVRGIYKAKGRPADNPLIIHICDLSQLRTLLLPNQSASGTNEDPIPAIYKPLINRFWPGPLTILLPKPKDSVLASEVTAGLPTFGARMPNSELALSLIKLAGVPIAAPSANASTKPSTTTAQHVAHDLRGKIELIIDGGPCPVGVESTVVDGLHDPPLILRPGGLSIDAIRECEGWAMVRKGYQDASELGHSVPRAPGMKYKHYSPTAKLVLYEAGAVVPELRQRHAEEATSVQFGTEVVSLANPPSSRPVKIGVIKSKTWRAFCSLPSPNTAFRWERREDADSFSSTAGRLEYTVPGRESRVLAELMGIELGSGTARIARGLFAALRDLDLWGADVILVEGIRDEGDIAAAVMNRLRKAATQIVT